MLLLLLLVAHLCFLGMSIAWTRYWIDGSIVPKTERQYIAYACALICLITFGVVIVGVLFRRRRLQNVSTLLCVMSFLAIFFLL